MQELINKIICWDCLEVMKNLPDKCVDLVLTDPPYGINMNKHFGNWSNNNLRISDTNRDEKIPEKEYFDEIFRVSKNQIIRGANYFVEYISPSMWWIVRDKNNGLSTFSDWELARTSFDIALRIKKVHLTGASMKYTEDTNWKVHPTQKPLELFRRCLYHYSKEGDIILDPFAWSWTTAVAAKEIWRKYIAIEKEHIYIDVIERRLQTATISLF